jgi:hypothetical protein
MNTQLFKFDKSQLVSRFNRRNYSAMSIKGVFCHVDLLTQAGLIRMRTFFKQGKISYVYICVPIVKRDKRMRDAGRGAGRNPAAEHPHA